MMTPDELARLRAEAEQGLESVIAVTSKRTTKHVFVCICVENARRYIAALEAQAAAGDDPLSEVDAQAEQLDPGHLLRVNQELRRRIAALKARPLPEPPEVK